MPMGYKFTLLIYLKHKIVGTFNKSWDLLLRKGLSDGFSPSEKTLNNIRAFADAYEFNKSEQIGTIEYLKN